MALPRRQGMASYDYRRQVATVAYLQLATTTYEPATSKAENSVTDGHLKVLNISKLRGDRKQATTNWLVVFDVPSTARSYRDGAPIYCPLRWTWSSVNTLFPTRIEPRAVVWQSITQPLRHASFYDKTDDHKRPRKFTPATIDNGAVDHPATNPRSSSRRWSSVK